jgi:photosystem II stability/assembly factor-like uncharacterized protein
MDPTQREGGRRRGRAWHPARAIWIGLALAVALSPAAGAGEEAAAGLAPETWELPHADLYGVASRGEHVWAVGYWGTLLRSRDAGRSWERVATPVHETLFGVDFADARHGFAVGERGVVLRTSDGGASWVLEPTPEQEPEQPARHLFAVAAVSPTQAWAVGDLGTVLHLREGEGWGYVRIPDEAFADDETPERIFTGVAFTDPERGWIVGEFGTVLRTEDGGQTWQGERRFEGAPPDLQLFGVSALDGERLAAPGLAGQVLVSDDGGRSFESRRAQLETSLYGVSWRNPLGVAVGEHGAMRSSSDLGRSWREPARPPLVGWLMAVTHADAGRLYAVGERGVILGSDDDGASWTWLRGAPAQGLASAPPEDVPGP